MNLDDYSYELPESLIAQHPADPRDSCKLMIIGKNKIEHGIFRDILSQFSKGDILVLNNTKVKHSKLLGKKESGSAAEITLLKNISANIYEAKIKTKNPLVGTKIILHHATAEIIMQKNIDTFVVKLDNKNALKDAVMPSPPYIKHVVTDKEYQTVYSDKKKEGSLASPTAGLHFTKSLLAKIQKKGVKIVYITLHVSYGTFKNIEDVKTYVMEPEHYEISNQAAKIINNRDKKKNRLFVVGTTTLKALETSASKSGKIIAGSAESTLFIYPPYKFKSGTDALITNFHLPKSTLLLLTCAFGERKRILDAYHAAIKNNYRFYSLGDSMIIYK
ncbi:MAG TPA: tRNA preQ1(34) S-adenosylmethionine ribosyltransferase-isomerase QueA [Alphaproteobacteria bacterium]|nr:tRNA preQ1(34) S-adenosylmethionine ribosyltransferase-isomerase QueA [Alphaproteobacteria bacterium]